MKKKKQDSFAETGGRSYRTQKKQLRKKGRLLFTSRQKH